MKASNLSRAAGTVYIQQQCTDALDLCVGRPCLVHADILLISTTQCLSLFVTLMPKESFLSEPRARSLPKFRQVGSTHQSLLAESFKENYRLRRICRFHFRGWADIHM